MSSGTAAAIFRTNETESAWAYLSPSRLVGDLARRRQLIWQFTMREVQGRYRGSYLGIVWALITPLMTLAVYTFVFHNVFKARWNGANPNENFMVYAMNMFSGIVAFNVFAESVSNAPKLIVANPNYVKKVVFPLEIMPVALVGSAIIHSLLSLLILIVGIFWGAWYPHLSLLYVPIVCVPLVALTAGTCWFLASLGVFLRDIGNLVTVAVQLLFFLTPITYSIYRLSPDAQRLMALNPLAAIVENFRRVVNDGLAPQWTQLGLVTLVSLIVAFAGYAWFMKIKRAFADVI